MGMVRRHLHRQRRKLTARTMGSADRRTRGKGGIDAVAILALLSHPSRPTSVVLVHQYRPPVESVVVELPAGLIDEGEKPDQTAIRERVAPFAGARELKRTADCTKRLALGRARRAGRLPSNPCRR